METKSSLALWWVQPAGWAAHLRDYFCSRKLSSGWSDRNVPAIRKLAKRCRKSWALLRARPIVRQSGGHWRCLDVIIDFTFPAVSLQTVQFARREKKPAVIGSTGFSAEEMEKYAN